MMMTKTWLARESRSLVTCVLLLAACYASGQGGARADESSEPLPGVYVEDAVAIPASAGDMSIIGFRLDNFSSGNVLLLGVTSEVAETALVLMRGGGTGPQIAKTVLIMQDEILDLRTSHIWTELRGLKSEITEGDLVHFELIFDRGRVAAQAHAHVGTMPNAR